MTANIVNKHPHPERIPFKRIEKIKPIKLRSHPDNPKTTNNTITNIIIPMIDKTSMLNIFITYIPQFNYQISALYL